MAAAWVQDKSNGGFSATTVDVTLDSNVTSTNLLVVGVFWLGTTTLNSVSDGLGNTYTLLTANAHDSKGLRMAYAKNIAAGACTVTATMSGSTSFVQVYVHEVSGCDTAAPFDGEAFNGQTLAATGTDTVTSTAITTTANGDYLFGMTGTGNSPGIAAGTGYTQREFPDTGQMSEDRVQAVAGSIAATFSRTDANSATHLTAVAAFKAAGAGGRTTKNTRAFPLGMAIGMHRGEPGVCS